MCGRMTLTRSGDEIAAFFAAAVEALDAAASVEELTGSALRPRFNLAPSRDALTLVAEPVAETSSDFVPAFAWKRWGLLPKWAKDPTFGNRTFNARSETVSEKPSFRAAFRRRRCLVAADGFYEWTPKNRDHRPFYFTPKDAPLLGFAGLHEHWVGEGGEVIESCTVITSEANADMDGVHHRMPVILSPRDYGRWLAPEAEAAALLALLRPADPGTLERRPVGRYVNDPRHDDARCLEPEARAEQGALFDLGEGAESDGVARGRRGAKPALSRFDEEF